MASISVTPSARAACITCSKRSSGIRAAHLDFAEARGTRPVAGAHHLLGLSFAAVGNTPERPVFAARDGRTRIPELGGDPAVARILQHASALAMTDLPPDLAAELKVVPLVVDRPAAIGLHVESVVHVEDLFERLLPR